MPLAALAVTNAPRSVTPADEGVTDEGVALVDPGTPAGP
jgi:hypothetical protein